MARSSRKSEADNWSNDSNYISDGWGTVIVIGLTVLGLSAIWGIGYSLKQAGTALVNQFKPQPTLQTN